MADSLGDIESRIRALEARLAGSEAEIRSVRAELVPLRAQLAALSAGPAAARPGATMVPPPVPRRETAAESKAAPLPSQDRAVVQSVPRQPPPPRPPSSVERAVSSLIALVRKQIGEIPMEEFVGMNLLNKIGILILVLGVSFFLRIAYAWISPALKVAMLSAVSIGIMFTGDFFYKKKNYVVFGLGLLSGGMVMLFFTAFAAHNFEATRIIPADQHLLGFTIQALLTGLMIANSLRYNREMMTSFAYFLAFLCVSINETSDFNQFSLIVIGLLAASLIFIITVKKWKYLTGLGILATYANFFVYSLSLPRSGGYVVRGESDLFILSLIYLFLYWLVFHVSTFTMPRASALDLRAGASVNIANASAFTALVAHIRPEPTVWGGMIVFGSMGVLYAVSAVIARQRKIDHLWKSNIVIGSALIALGLGLRFSGPSLVLVWLVQGTILVVTGYLFREPYLRNLGYAAFVLKLFALLALPSVDVLWQEGPVISLEMELNRGAVYTGIILAALCIHIISREKEKTQIDRGAWHALGVLMVFAAVMLALFSITLPHQAILLGPLSLALLVAGRYLRIPPYFFYGTAVLVFAALFSSPLIGKGPEFTSNLSPLYALLILWVSAAGFFGFLASPLQTAEARMQVRNRQHAYYLITSGALALAVTVTVSIIVNYGPAWVVALFCIIPAVVLGGLEKTTSHGRIHFLGLCLFVFLLTIREFVEAVSQDSETARFVFLSNGGTLYAMSTLPLWGLRNMRESSGWVARTLLFVSSVEALMLLRQIVTPELYASSVAAYALAIVIASVWLRSPAVLAAAVLTAFSLLAGPIRETLFFTDVTGALARTDLVIVAFCTAASCAALWKQKEDGIPVFYYYSAYLAAYLATYLILPLEFHASVFSLLTLSAFWILRQYLRPGIAASARLFPAASIVSVVYLLVKLNLNPLLHEAWLKGLLGLFPLAVLAFCLRLYTDALKARSMNPAKDRFRITLIAILMLLFIAFTMTLIDARYWSIAWAAEGTALILMGLVWRTGTLRYAGMVLIAVMLAKIAFWDLKNLDDTLRVAVLVGIGLLLVGASFLYARFKDRWTEDPKEPGGK